MTKFSSDFMEPRDPNAAIDAAMAAVYRQNGNGHGVVAQPTTIEAFRAEEDEMDSVERHVQIESIGRMLRFFYETGPDPRCVLQRVTLLTSRYLPDLLGNISDAELALLLGETRAAVSHRGMVLFTNKLHLAGAAGTRTRGQKSAASCAKFSKRAEGNSNRAKKKERKAA